MRNIYVIAHDMRSTYNVGSLFRTSEGLGVKKLFLTGYTPYPKLVNDTRLPHIANKLHDQIQKTALNAQDSLEWDYNQDIFKIIENLKSDGIKVAALEQTDSSINLPDFDAPNDIALILGTEVTGLPEDILREVDFSLVIPMFGNKESFNVVQAAAMAIYQIRFH